VNKCVQTDRQTTDNKKIESRRAGAERVGTQIITIMRADI
jgi:hypothetical protein